MEALPRMIMISPQFRTSQWTYDNIPKFDFRSKVKEYILMHFQADPHAYDEAFNDLANMKFECNNPSVSVEMSCVLKRYYGQLCMIQKRFPMAPGQELETPFAWYDSFLESRSNNEISYNDVEFEKASVMFNIGAVHSQIAVKESRETQDSIKNAFMHFQYAASAFEKLRNEKFEDAYYPSIDLDPQVLEFLQRLMIAQAQECLVQKSLLDNRSHVVIAKLAKWLHEEYEKCGKLVEEWNVNINDRVQRYKIKVCQLKSNIYATIAFLSLGDHAEVEMKKMGYRLAFFNIAKQHLTGILKEKSLADKVPEFISTISFLNDVVQAKQTNAEKENNFIYHERVPKDEELQEELKESGPFSSMCKAKPLAFDPLDRSVCGDDIFGTLLPATVLQSVSLYEEKKSQVKRDILEELFQANQELETFLGKAAYNDLRWMLNEGKDVDKMFVLPDILLERNAELTAQPDAIPALLDRLRESSDSSRIAEAKLNTLISKLRTIDLPRLKNDEGYVLISKELEKLNEHLGTAKANNVSLNKAIAAHSASLQDLSLPLYELKAKLLPDNHKKIWRNSCSKEEMILKKVMDKIEEMKSQREKLRNQLEEDLQRDDISKELLAQRDFSNEDVFEKELKKHDDTIRYIRMNICAQDNVLHAFTEANADFCDERLQFNKGTEQFNEQVLVLLKAYDIFKDVAMKVSDGEKFYRQLMQRCEQFAIPIHAMEEQYREEFGKREREKREVEERANMMRRQKETRDAMAEFAMPGRFTPSAYTQPGSHSSMRSEAPKLRDFLDEYRNRKTNVSVPHSPIPNTVQYPITPIGNGEPAAPPSPTPSSVNEFPVSPNVGNSARRAADAYIPQRGVAAPNGYFMGPPISGPACATPTPNQDLSVYQQQQYHGSYQFQPVNPAQNYSMPPPMMTTQSHPAPPASYSITPTNPVPTMSQNYAIPPVSNSASHPNMAAQDYSVSTMSNSVASLNTPIFSPPNVSAAQFNSFVPHPNTLTPVPNPNATTQNYPLPSASGAHKISQNSTADAFRTLQNPIPISNPMTPQNPMPTSNAFGTFQNPMPASNPMTPKNPSSNSFGILQNPIPTSNHHSIPQNPTMTPNSLPQNSIPNPLKVPHNTAPTPHYQQPAFPQYQSTKPETPILAQNRSPVPNPNTPTQFSAFRPVQQTHGDFGKSNSSPWHATPTQASPWNYNAPLSQSTPIPTPNVVNQQPPVQSNVDLLSDLLGDLNLPPPLQPSVQNVQNLKKPDFRAPSTPAEPDKRSVSRPAATVMPMPQQSVATSPMNSQPILSMNCASSVSFQAPMEMGKFDIGNGDRQKLEKRMLHHSIRTNGPPPPLDQSDPINQIDPFQIVNRK